MPVFRIYPRQELLLYVLIVLAKSEGADQQEEEPLVGWLQGIAVRGRLLCGETPLQNAVVKIIDIDKKDKDDLLDVGLTESDGTFSLFGSTTEDEPMQAAIKIYHNCGDKKKSCQRKVTWEVPRVYNHNGTISRWFDIGNINMELKFRGEERDCRHRRRRHHLRGARHS